MKSLRFVFLAFVMTMVAETQPESTPPRLTVGGDGHYLTNDRGTPVFLLADTAWSLVRQLKREDVRDYLKARREQGFNAITFVAISSIDAEEGAPVDAYGHAAFERDAHDRPDPLRPILGAPGAATNAKAGFWPHVDFCIDEAARQGMYVILLPAWGSAVAGGYDGSRTKEILFDTADSASAYGRFLGARYRDRTNLLWMLGGDRSAVYGKGAESRDFRPIFSAMGRGIVEGIGGSAPGKPLISFHPQKRAAQSSEWFHQDTWFGFNSIQEWPEAQIGWVTKDWAKSPAKPTWVFEGRYEAYYRSGYKPEQWGAWQVRQQAYQSVFSGAFGFTYGNEMVFGFGKPTRIGPKDSPPAGGWRDHLQDAGATQLCFLARLMATLSAEQYLSRVPDQELLVDDVGKAERLRSDRVTATRSGRGDLALFYTAGGRRVAVRLDRLAGPSLEAYWFDPRTGKWLGDPGKPDDQTPEPRPFRQGVPTGGDAAPDYFDPPHGRADGNDWVLILRQR
jgi:hypothetical protein